MPLIFKDGVSENTHYLNLVEVSEDSLAPWTR